MYSKIDAIVIQDGAYSVLWHFLRPQFDDLRRDSRFRERCEEIESILHSVITKAELQAQGRANTYEGEPSFLSAYRRIYTTGMMLIANRESPPSDVQRELLEELDTMVLMVRKMRFHCDVGRWGDSGSEIFEDQYNILYRLMQMIYEVNDVEESSILENQLEWTEEMEEQRNNNIEMARENIQRLDEELVDALDQLAEEEEAREQYFIMV